MRRRKQHIADLAREYKADGIIVASNKFCEYWSYERVIDTVVLQRDFGYPSVPLRRVHQLRQRPAPHPFPGVHRGVEIKKIRRAQRNEKVRSEDRGG